MEKLLWYARWKVTIEIGKVILQKVEILPKKNDWENEDRSRRNM